MLQPRLSDEEKEKSIAIYKDSHYALATIHAHGMIYKVRGSSLLGERTIITKRKSWHSKDYLASPVAFIFHCEGHQKDDYPQIRSNLATDLDAH